MSWRDRVAALPVTLPHQVPKDGECIEAKIDDVHVMASHVFVSLAGNMLMFSLSGSQVDIGAFASHLDEEMGSPAMREILPGGMWMRSYSSPVDSLPDVEVHTKISAERIREIGAEEGLNSAETRILQEMIVAQNAYAHDAIMRVQMFHGYLRRCDNSERGRKVVDALAVVRAEIDAAL